jgi:hypothetical protein
VKVSLKIVLSFFLLFLLFLCDHLLSFVTNHFLYINSLLRKPQSSLKVLRACKFVIYNDDPAFVARLTSTTTLQSAALLCIVELMQFAGGTRRRITNDIPFGSFEIHKFFGSFHSPRTVWECSRLMGLSSWAV